MKFLTLTVLVVLISLAGAAKAGTAGVGGTGILADVYVGKYIGNAVYQTKGFALPIRVRARTVFLQKCLDKVRVIYTKEDGAGKEIPMASLTARVSAEYGKPVIVTTITSYNCVDWAQQNWIKFTHNGEAGDPAFFNAVERTLNSWLEGAKVVVPLAADPPTK